MKYDVRCNLRVIETDLTYEEAIKLIDMVPKEEREFYTITTMKGSKNVSS